MKTLKSYESVRDTATIVRILGIVILIGAIVVSFVNNMDLLVTGSLVLAAIGCLIISAAIGILGDIATYLQTIAINTTPRSIPKGNPAQQSAHSAQPAERQSSAPDHFGAMEGRNNIAAPNSPALDGRHNSGAEQVSGKTT